MVHNKAALVTLLLLLLLLSWWARQALPIWGDRCPEEMRNSTRLWIRRDLSLPRDSWQPFYWLGHHSRAAVVAHSWRIVNRCQTINVDGCRQTAKLQSVLWLCSGFYRSKDPTNSIIVLKEPSTKGVTFYCTCSTWLLLCKYATFSVFKQTCIREFVQKIIQNI